MPFNESPILYKNGENKPVDFCYVVKHLSISYKPEKRASDVEKIAEDLKKVKLGFKKTPL